MHYFLLRFQVIVDCVFICEFHSQQKELIFFIIYQHLVEIILQDNVSIMLRQNFRNLLHRFDETEINFAK